jgi:cell division septation protein DedD
MQKNGKRGGGDRVLESRHLVMLFLSVVLLCGVFFTLGYVMGHTQYGAAPVHAENASTHPTPAPAPPRKLPSTPTTKAPCDSSWDNCSNSAPEEKPVVAPAPSKSKPKAEPIPNPKSSGPATPVPIPGAAARGSSSSPAPVSKNGILLQVAAVKQQRDAIQMADELQKKKFPAFVVDSKADGFYHVQVGPYADKASAETARHALEGVGFKAIIKH